MNFYEWLSQNGFADVMRGNEGRKATATLKSFMDAYIQYLNAKRRQHYEAWRRKVDNPTQTRTVLQALLKAFPTLTTGRKDLSGLEKADLDLSRTQMMKAIKTFDDQLSTQITRDGSAQLTAEDQKDVKRFCGDASFFCEQLWGPNHRWQMFPRQAQLWFSCLKSQVSLWGRDLTFNVCNTNFTKVKQTSDVVAKAISHCVSRPLITFDKWKVEKKSEFDGVTACIDFWAAELPRMRERIPRICQLLGLAPGAHTQKLKRFISQGEVESLKKVQGFCQYPGKLEREKWFFTDDASPGDGVQHDYIATFEVGDGTLALLDGLAVLRDDAKALENVVYKKQNEGGCYGIHEDALGAMNCLIRKVTIVKRIQPKTVVHAIDFKGWDRNALNQYYQQLLAQITLMQL
jgi:hypothetical protein